MDFPARGVNDQMVIKKAFAALTVLMGNAGW